MTFRYLRRSLSEGINSAADSRTLASATTQSLDASRNAETELVSEEDPCWPGYTQVGMKTKNGRKVPNCVPSKGVPKAKGYKKEEADLIGDVIDEDDENDETRKLAAGHELDSDDEDDRTVATSPSGRGYREASSAHSFVPPKSVRMAAERGLELRRKHGAGGLSSREAGKQGIGSGVVRAQTLASGEGVSLDTLKRMRSFFARHAKNKAGSAEKGDRGAIAWLLWGGDPGRDWVERELSKIEKEVMSEQRRRWGSFFEADLTSAERNSLPDSAFADPKARKLPVHDETHARLAWSMLSRTEDLQTPVSQVRKNILSALKRFGVNTDAFEEAVLKTSPPSDLPGFDLDLQGIFKAMKGPMGFWDRGSFGSHSYRFANSGLSSHGIDLLLLLGLRPGLCRVIIRLNREEATQYHLDQFAAENLLWFLLSRALRASGERKPVKIYTDRILPSWVDRSGLRDFTAEISNEDAAALVRFYGRHEEIGPRGDVLSRRGFRNELIVKLLGKSASLGDLNEAMRSYVLLGREAEQDRDVPSQFHLSFRTGFSLPIKTVQTVHSLLSKAFKVLEAPSPRDLRGEFLYSFVVLPKGSSAFNAVSRRFEKVLSDAGLEIGNDLQINESRGFGRDEDEFSDEELDRHLSPGDRGEKPDSGEADQGKASIPVWKILSRKSPWMFRVEGDVSGGPITASWDAFSAKGTIWTKNKRDYTEFRGPGDMLAGMKKHAKVGDSLARIFRGKTVKSIREDFPGAAADGIVTTSDTGLGTDIILKGDEFDDLRLSRAERRRRLIAKMAKAGLQGTLIADHVLRSLSDDVLTEGQDFRGRAVGKGEVLAGMDRDRAPRFTIDANSLSKYRSFFTLEAWIRLQRLIFGFDGAFDSDRAGRIVMAARTLASSGMTGLVTVAILDQAVAAASHPEELSIDGGEDEAEDRERGRVPLDTSDWDTEDDVEDEWQD